MCSERHKSTQKRIYFVQLDLLNYSGHPQNVPWFSLAVVELCSIWRMSLHHFFWDRGGIRVLQWLDFFSSFSAWLWVWHLELWAFLFSNILVFLQEPLVFADSLDSGMTTQLWNQKSNRDKTFHLWFFPAGMIHVEAVAANVCQFVAPFIPLAKHYVVACNRRHFAWIFFNAYMNLI